MPHRFTAVSVFTCSLALAGSACATSAEAPLVAGSPTASSSPEATVSPHRAQRASRIRSWSGKRISLTVGQRFTDRIRVVPKGRRTLTTTLVETSTSRRRTKKGRVGRRGFATASVKPPRAGDYRLRLAVSANRRGAATRTRFRRVTVTGEIPEPAAVYAYVTGDIGDCKGVPGSTARLIPQGAKVLVSGDVAYPKGTRSDFNRCYLPFYGKFLDTTYPVPGNHEYLTADLAYFDVFGTRVGTRRTPWYQVRLGSWRFLMLNSNCAKVGGCEPGSRQYRWVERQLATNTDRCLAAVWHAPRWSSGRHGSDWGVASMFRLLAGSGTDVLFSGHDHSYERFTRLNGNGRPSPTGLRQIVVGTGGAKLYAFRTPLLGSQVRSTGHFGVLRVRLAADGYSWQFLATDGASVDRGSDTC